MRIFFTARNRLVLHGVDQPGIGSELRQFV
jgi:hypothetical protein